MACAENAEIADKYIRPQDQDDTQDIKQVEEKCSENELRVVIVGRTGSGISSLGNNLLNNSCYFDSKRSTQSVTRKSCRGDVTRNWKKICVVETPGLYNTSFSHDYIEKEITNSLNMVAPGPHVVLYVCRVGRHSEEEIQSLKWIIDIFGNDVFKYTVVVFSGKDFLNGQDIHDWVEGLPAAFGSFIEKCKGRYISVNSQAYGPEGDEQWNELLSLVQSMMSKNVPTFFSQNESQPRKLLRLIKRRACHLVHIENNSTNKKIFFNLALILAFHIFGFPIRHTLYDFIISIWNMW